MKKLIIFSLLILALVSCSGSVVHNINFSPNYNPDKIHRIAIINFEKDGAAHIDRNMLVDKFTTAMVGSRFQLVDRSDMQKIMQEVKFQYSGSGMIDEKTKEKLQELGADSILTGTVHNYTENKGASSFILYSGGLSFRQIAENRHRGSALVS